MSESATLPSPPANVSERQARLNEELDRTTEHYRLKARKNYRWAIFLVILSLGASIAVAVAGLFFEVPSRILGGLALIPALVTTVNTIMQPQARASWHYKKKDLINALRRKLIYELPNPPTVDAVCAVSAAWTKVDSEMDDRWERTLTFDWKALAALGRQATQDDQDGPKQG